ncbi:glycosyltransferase family 2 protein [Pseudomonas sp. PDM20]|uniref:glycosyltransferase family 2 protein n=1 Tax=Pseudomonas sp. PDM20 TaxID=2769254 RepID=UPI001786122C|nr:glycosyltransferase family 2 protein [Pseudomonas sp. PDM20]MBD9682634.1 glycosyltransferase family 2 protein [Pseudomonas sp. PDM20]
MPCLNEAETIESCVLKAISFLRVADVQGEVLVADNGSTDGSQALAEKAGARVISVRSRGYGAALQGGIDEAAGAFVIMGDADDSYDFERLEGMLERLREGYELVMGNRFAGGIEKGAMPFLHRYLGNPVLSFIGRLFFKAPVGDFHCGLRGFSREAILKLDLNSPGMEFASEMVVKASLQKLRICEVPITLSPDGRSRPPHLRTWRDGWRHLKFLLIFSPHWLFFVPGLLLFVLSSLLMVVIDFHPIVVRDVGLDVHTLVYAGAGILLGLQMVFFSVFSRLVGMTSGWLPIDARWMAALSRVTLERGILLSLALFAFGGWMTWEALLIWSEGGFGALDPRVVMRWVVPSVTAIALGGEVFLAAFFLETLRIPARKAIA